MPEENNKYLRVKRTIYPNIHQMQNMATNLRVKFKQSSYIEITVWDYSLGHTTLAEEKYSIYIADTYDHRPHKTWKDLQDDYFNLMSGKVPPITKDI
jgi:hypothetical protein